MTIASSHFVFCVAMPGTGKTFTGDYLDIIHGFHHVDGDLPYRTAHLPKMREVVFKKIEGSKRVKEPKSSDDLKGSEECWEPFFQVMVESALEAANTKNKVVITYACAFNIQRDFVIHKLTKGGTKNVTLIYLDMNKRKKLEGLYHRSVKQAVASGVSLGDQMRVMGWDGKGDEPSMNEYIHNFMSTRNILNPVFEDPPPDAVVVDITERDVTVIDGVDDALGLQRSGEESYDEIVKKVVERDHQRDRETPYSMELIPGIKKEVEEAMANATTEEEKNQIKRRASSLVGMELMMHRLSMASDTLRITSDTNDDTVRTRRRSSFITTGKIE
mmetsp:Transcript_53460/g.59705  ORF Transcript_53460/g.59705 Transcript_53460/m.59705 type:complete len:330 (+) Transcript_53460:36-1025(+)|eukprot:CAMPEP_0170762938 /NCGR_PEP_ID=MMETSP0733-20121128/3073_1 /TAXON_ID=186038 /ORGANISM="Fragilariopsis kerguelensis, Strain L26-C5" /LENGTH=329 /DNA_ID=CAMNT_0011103225 /DNA_START=13 /DNA_END=1002 /DNA_ORIENTATION=+